MKFESYADKIVPKGVEMPKVKLDQKYYSKFGIEDSASNAVVLKSIVWQGLKDKGFHKDQRYIDRVKFELDMFENLQYTDYILMVWDLCNFAIENDIAIGKGRGSAAGSVVLFLIGVTGVDSVKYDLYFERFVSPSRAKRTEIEGVTYFDGSLLCDIDLDFDYNDRQRVIEYINQKYPAKVSHILTINTFSGKLVFKEVMKVLGNFTEEDAGEIAAHIPKEFGNVKPLDVARTESTKFDEFCANNPKIYKVARKLENLNKNFGVHPSGIAVSAHAIDTLLPLQLTGEGKLVTGVEMNYAAELAVKVDILGLRTLSVLKEAGRLAGINVNEIDPEHPSIYAALQVLDSPQGIFQIEADSQFAACQKIKPANILELSDLLALARPGGMDHIPDYVEAKKSGLSKDYGNDKLSAILNKTKGIPTYQEQMMKMGHEVFGLTLDEAETLRRVVGKKKVEEMPVWKDRIYANCEKLGIDKSLGDFYWKVLDDSKNYSFNFSHSVAYGVLAAQTLYLKFNHPQAFYTALLKMSRFEQDPQDQVSKISHELKNFNIKLLPPDLIKSWDDFSIEKDDIRYGLSSIKGVNEKSIAPLEAFKGMQRSTKFEVFKNAVEAKVNMGILSSLIQSGALSSCGDNRPRMMLEAQTFKVLSAREQRLAMEWENCYNSDLLTLIADLYQTQKPCSDGKPFMKESRWNTFKGKYENYKQIYRENCQHPELARWWFEKERLGYSYSTALKDCFVDKQYIPISSLGNYAGRDVNVVAFVEDVIVRKSLKGNRYMKITLSDETGSINSIMVDSAKQKKLSDFLEKSKAEVTKKSIISLAGSVAKDATTIFINSLDVSDTRIFMKTSELK